MQLYCPSCQATCAASDRCPRCGDRLVTPAEAFASAPDFLPPPPEPLRPTPLGRVAVGVVVALGLYAGFREWATAVAGDDLWRTTAGFVVGSVLRGIALVGGGLLAGAGRRHAASSGASVGLVCVGLLLAADVALLGPAGPVEFGVAAGLVVLAAVAGAVGGLVWPAEAEAPDVSPIRPRGGSSLVRLADERRRAKAVRPTSWSRVLIGACVVVAGVAVADWGRVNIKKRTGGYVNTGGPAQAPLADLQLAGLVMILGAVTAAAGTGAGLRHGVLAGVLGGAAAGGLALSPGVATPIVEGLYEMVGQPAGDVTGPRAALLLGTFALVVCSLGGWAGGQLFPPLAPPWLRHKLIAMT